MYCHITWEYNSSLPYSMEKVWKMHEIIHTVENELLDSSLWTPLQSCDIFQHDQDLGSRQHWRHAQEKPVALGYRCEICDGWGGRRKANILSKQINIKIQQHQTYWEILFSFELVLKLFHLSICILTFPRKEEHALEIWRYSKAVNRKEIIHTLEISSNFLT